MDVLTLIFAAAWVLTLGLLVRSLFRQAGIEDAVKETADQATAQMHLWEEFGQHLDEGVAIVDETGAIVYANERFAGLTGAVGRSAIGQALEQVLSLQDASAEPAELPTGTVTKQLFVLAAGGARTPVRVVRRSLHKPDGYGVVVMQDDSASLAEREIRQRLVKLSSFELRAPVTAAKGYASMLDDGDVGKLPKDAVEPVKQILESCEQILTIIDDMANVEALSSKKQSARLEEVDLAAYLESIKPRLVRVAEASGRKLQIGSGTVQLHIKADREQIARLLTMLVNTAARTAEERSEVDLTVRLSGQAVNIELSNHGKPLPKDSQANVFDYAGGGGLDEGIGFHVAKQIIEAHHAYVTVNTKAHGNVFVLSLPAIMQPPVTAAPDAPKPDPQPTEPAKS